ncbi:hypothetical protein CCACVL1_03901 [Corchorus capsularis]|uniref:Mitochondrial pyruvate carrier n=1 Tax=Corchorus capsularis TaxID=210143 RepID=A0A1R3JWD3_COCAP|nr:hypothetical protein CCACVL1_03901 [Corchorus capsularis]
MESLESLNLNGTAIKSLPSSIGNLINLTTLNLEGTAINEVPASIENAVKLRDLFLDGATNLTKIPATFKLTALEQANSEIVANAHHNIQLMAAADVERVDLNDQVLYKGVSSAFFSLPTTEIPAWFNNQSIGSSVVVQLPPSCQNSQFLGFELCIVVESSEDDSHRSEVLSWLELDCNFKSKQGYSRGFSYSSIWNGRWFSARGPISDHLLLLYDQLIYAKAVEGDFSGDNSLLEASFQFCIASPAVGYTGMIKKCGVHLLYKNKNNEETSSEGQPTTSLSIDEEEDPEQIGGTQTVTNFESCNAEEDQESKEIITGFHLWDFNCSLPPCLPPAQLLFLSNLLVSFKCTGKKFPSEIAVHFWAPTFKWGINIANLVDISTRPAETVSYPQHSASS